MTEPSLSDILDFAVALSLEAGRFILPLWKKVAVEQKADGSEVTEADRGAERLLRKRITERYPDHAILGEEFGGEQKHDVEHLWLLDPVDGTASFAIGLPLFGTLIAYLRRGTACVGVIGAHAMHELVCAATGQGCWYQYGKSRPTRVWASAVAEPAQAFVVSTTLERTDMDPRNPMPAVRLSHLYRKARRFQWSGDCINYALLCEGHVDVALDSRMHPWDIAALVPCVREAGGVLTSLNGNDDVVWQPDLVASANRRLHMQVLELLRSEFPS
jgi:histidinol-phosphatase